MNLLLGVIFYCTFLDVQGQSVCSTNNIDTINTEKKETISEELELFFALNFNTHDFWNEIKGHYYGSDAEFEKIREVLTIRLYQLYSNFGIQCLEKEEISEDAKIVFKHLVNDNLLNLLTQEMSKEADSTSNDHMIPAPAPTPLECENLDFEKCDFTG